MSGKFLQQIAVTKFYFSHYLWFYRYGVKSVQIRSYFWSETFLYSDWIRRFSPNTGKYGPEITPYLDTFDAVDVISSLFLSLNAFILPATRKKINEIYTLFVKNTLLFIYSGKKKFHDKFLGTYFVCMWQILTFCKLFIS